MGLWGGRGGGIGGWGSRFCKGRTRELGWGGCQRGRGTSMALGGGTKGGAHPESGGGWWLEKVGAQARSWEGALSWGGGLYKVGGVVKLERGGRAGGGEAFHTHPQPPRLIPPLSTRRPVRGGGGRCGVTATTPPPWTPPPPSHPPRPRKTPRAPRVPRPPAAARGRPQPPGKRPGAAARGLLRPPAGAPVPSCGVCASGSSATRRRPDRGTSGGACGSCRGAG